MAEPSVAAAKTAVRTAALARRNVLSADARASAAVAIAFRAVAIVDRAHPRLVGAYRAYGSEADPGAIVAACLAARIGIALPAMTGGNAMVFRRYVPGDALAPDALGIPAPLPAAETTVPDLLLVPLTAFDRQGVRLGKGRGAYDRAIAALRAAGHAPLLVGIAFSVQEVAAIPREPHDVRLDWIVTEAETLSFSITS